MSTLKSVVKSDRSAGGNSGTQDLDSRLKGGQSCGAEPLNLWSLMQTLNG